MSINVNGGELSWEAIIEDSQFNAKIRSFENKLTGLDRTVQKSGLEIETIFKRAAIAAGSLFSLNTGFGLIKQITDVRGQFQQLDVAFTTILKSKEKANVLMGEVVQLAATTPFGLTEVATGAKQLLAYGTNAKDVTSTLTMLGNVAAGVSAPIGDLVYLYGTLQTQGRAYTKDILQFTSRGIPIIDELAKQFRTTKDRVQDLVEAGKVGFPEVQKAFQSLTGQGGIFFNLMQEQSKTLTGQIANLSDAFDVMLNNIGKSNQGILSGAIASATDLVNNYQKVLDAIEVLVIAYGSYRAALIVSATYQKLIAANSVGYVAALNSESVAKIAAAEASLTEMRAEVSNLAAKKASTLQRAVADAAVVRSATQRLAAAKASEAASAADIYSSTRAADAKAVQAASEELLAAKEKASISRKASLAASSQFYTTQQELEIVAKEANAVATVELTEVEAINAAGKRVLTGVQAAYNSVMAIAPMAAYTAGLAALAVVVYALTADTNALKKSQESLVDISLEANKSISAQKDKLESLKRVLNDTNRSEQDRLSAAKALRDVMGDRLKQYTDEELLAGKAAKAIANYTGELLKSAKAAAAQNKLQDLDSQLLSTDLNGQVGDSRRDKVNAAFDAIPFRERLKFSLTNGNNEAAVNAYRTYLQQQKNAIVNAYQKSIDETNANINNVDDGLSDAERERTKRFAANLADAVKNVNALIKDASSKGDISKIKEAIQGQIDALAPGNEKIDSYKKQLQKVQAIEGQYGLAADKKANNTLESEFEKRRSIYDKVAALQAEQLSNYKTANEREIDDTKAKYQTILNEIDKYNRTAATKLPRSVVAKVLGIQDADVKGKEAKQQLEADKTGFEAQKQLYVQYEQYKTQFGKKAADERYANQLKGATSYQQFLENLEQGNKGNTGAYASALTDFLSKELPKARIDAAKENFAFLNSVLADTQTYEQKLAVLKQNYEKAALTASLNGNEENVIIAKESYEQQVDGLNESHQQRLRLINGFNQNVVELTRQQALSQIGALKQLLAGANSLTDKQRGEVADKVTQLENALGTKNGLKNLPLNQLKDNVQQLKKELDGLKNSGGSFDALKQKAEELAKAQDAVNDETKKLDELPIDKLNAAGEAMNSLSSNLNGISPELAQIISGLGGFAIQLANVIELSKKMGSEGASFSDYANAVASGASFLANTIGSIVSASKARKEAEQAYYNAVISQQNQYNISLNEEIRLRSQLKESVFSKDYAGRILDGSKALVDANAKFNKSLADLQKGQAKIGQRDKVDVAGTVMSTLKGAGTGAAIGSVVPVIGTAVGAVVGGIIGAIGGLFSKKKKDVFGGLLTEYPELIGKAADGTAIFNKELAQSLIANNLVDDATKVMLQNTIDLAEQRAKAIEQINGVISDLAGSLGDDLRNALVNAAKDGTDAFDAFGDSVSKVIENIISQMLFQEVFGAQLKGLEDEMKASYAAGGDQNFVDDIARFYENAGPLIEQFNAGLKAANEEGKKNGLNVFEKGDGGSGISGAVKREITETTGSAIEGLMRSQQQYAAQTFKINQEQLELWKGQAALSQKHFDIANRNLETAIKIEANTFRTAENTDRLQSMEKSLASIDKKTSASGTTPGYAGGFPI